MRPSTHAFRADREFPIKVIDLCLAPRCGTAALILSQMHEYVWYGWLEDEKQFEESRGNVFVQWTESAPSVVCEPKHGRRLRTGHHHKQ